LKATGAVVPVGYDGQAFIEDLTNRNLVMVQFPNGQRCSASFEYRPVADEIPKIGPLLCVKDTP
jgi:outer membrane usher protein